MQDGRASFAAPQSASLSAKKRLACCIGVAQACMLRCKMCFFWKNNYVENPQEPALNEWHNFISSLADLNDYAIEIDFAGGEPLFDERNLALVNFAVKKGIYTSLPTNGFLIDKDMAHKIADSGLDVITISLDGINKNTHDFLRGVEGSYDKIMQGIDYLDRCCSNLTIGIQTIISEKNLDEIAGLAQWANGHKRIRYIVFQAIVQPFSSPFDKEWYKRKEYSFLWPQDIKKVYTVINELIRLKEAGCKITNPVSQLEVFKAYFTNPHSFIKKTKCSVGEHYMNINQFGDVFMCLRKNCIGNIKNHSSEELWHSQKAARLREEMVSCKDNCHHLLNCCYDEERDSI